MEDIKKLAHTSWNGSSNMFLWLGHGNRSVSAIRPDLGGAWRWPQGLPSKWFPMQFTIGAQVEDILEINTPDAMLRRTGMGIECRQGLGGTALEIRSALGIQGGWPTAGLGISFFRVLQIDVATWAEEAGRYVGQNDMRHWTARVRLGGW